MKANIKDLMLKRLTSFKHFIKPIKVSIWKSHNLIFTLTGCEIFVGNPFP